MSLEGLTIPMMTVFGAEGALDAGRNARLARGLAEAGAEHLFILGSLGEFASLNAKERQDLTEAVIESLTRADAWVGCGAPSTAQAVEQAVAAEEAGAAALVCVPPYYLHPAPASIERYYRGIHAASGLPLLAYNIPSLVGYALTPSLVHGLAAEGVLAGVKDTSASFPSLLAFLQGGPEGFVVLPGDDALASEAILRGAAGAIMGTGNILPKLAVELVRAARARELSKIPELQGLVNALCLVLQAAPFPAADKFLAQKLRGVEVGYRSPYDALTPEEEARVLAVLAPHEAALRRFV
jgi:4-hydroxy-tetrahydrodipicolinate synthase